MFTKKNRLFRFFFIVLFLFGFVFLFRQEAFAGCDGEGSSLTITSSAAREDGQYAPEEVLEVTALITNVADPSGFKWFTLELNGWRHAVAFPESGERTDTLGGEWNGATIKFSPAPEQGGKPAWNVTFRVKLTSDYPYANRIYFTWTDTGEQTNASCRLGQNFYFYQGDACADGDGKPSFTWTVTTGDTPYSPGSVAVTSIEIADARGITDDISFFFDGWEFKYKGDNTGWALGSELTVTGSSGDTKRTATMRVPIASAHADGYHRINYSWAIKNSYRRCSAHQMILVSNPGVKGGTSTPPSSGGRIMPKTGLFENVNKTIVLGVGLVILGLIWVLVFPLIKKHRQVYFITPSQGSGVSRFGKQVNVKHGREKMKQKV